MSTDVELNKYLREFKPAEAEKREAQKLAKDKGKTGRGTIVIKPVKCGKTCSGCPHGPYAYHVSSTTPRKWTYLGSVRNVGKKSSENESIEPTTEFVMLAPQIQGELGSDTLEVEMKNTGNKKWVAKINGPDEKYGFEREWTIKYGENTGSVELEEGDIIEASRSSHSGKNTTQKYYQYTDGELVEVSKSDVESTVEQWEPSAKEAEKRDKRVVQEQLSSVQDGESVTLTTAEGTRKFTKKNYKEYIDGEGNVWLKDGTTIAPVTSEAFGTLLTDRDKTEEIVSVE